MKSVIIVDKELPLGLIANTTAVLGLSLGNRINNLIGPDIRDVNGKIHLGITTMPIPILGAARKQIKDLYSSVLSEEQSDLIAVDFNDIAQKSKTYEEYTMLLSNAEYENLQYLGICLYGPKKRINKLTGSIGLLK